MARLRGGVVIRMVALATLAPLALAACVPSPYEADPVSSYQWQRRQEAIQRQEAERVRLCALMNKDSDRFKRDCGRPGDPS
ncbi:hypothetical protein BH09PSE1_BH09PSE1_28090 [soil metagenome]